MPTNESIIEDAFDRHGQVFKKSYSLVAEITKGIEILIDLIKSDQTLFACGNGGSAADAQHLVGEWLCRYKDDRRPLRAVALTCDASTLTAIGNDYGFEQVFSRQVRALGGEKDVLVAISTSGTSKNVMNAISEARKKRMKVIVLTGPGGSDLEADVVIAIPNKEIARIQEIHELIIHAWCEAVDLAIKE